jgi:tetratricopeptide (TPR) repeat protein
MCLIYLGPKCEDVGRASHICDYLVRHFADKAGGSYPEVQSSAVKFAEAGVLLRRGEIQKAKASVLEALATAEAANAIQLKSMVLSLAGILFLDADPNKAEAMLTFAKQVAGDAKLDMIAAGAASSLQTLFAQTNRPEKAEKMGKQAEKFQAAHVKRQQPKTGHFEN